MNRKENRSVSKVLMWKPKWGLLREYERDNIKINLKNTIWVVWTHLSEETNKWTILKE
jgi:hypothetical protein